MSRSRNNRRHVERSEEQAKEERTRFIYAAIAGRISIEKENEE